MRNVGGFLGHRMVYDFDRNLHLLIGNEPVNYAENVLILLSQPTRDVIFLSRRALKRKEDND